MADAGPTALITVGRIVRPQGNRGEVVVASETDFGPERFRPGATFEISGEGRSGTLTVETGRRHGERWVVGFVGTTSIDAAELLRGLVLQVREDARMPLGPGQYYTHDLEGCGVETVAGDAVGTVSRVDLSPGTHLLVVEGALGGEVLVPLVDSICVRFDVGAKRIVIDPPAGLIALNAPGALKGRDR